MKFFPRSLTVAFVGAAAFLPVTLARAQTASTPVLEEDTYVRTSPNDDMIVGGLVLLGSAYGLSAGAAYHSDLPADDDLYIPVAGPWMDLATRPRCGDAPNRPTCDGEAVDKGLLVLSGITQGVGALEIVAGFLFPETEIVKRSPKVRVSATAGPTYAGVAAFGRF